MVQTKKTLSSEIERLKYKNTLLLRKSANLVQKNQKLSEFVELYANLKVESEFDKGFASAFEIVKNKLEELRL